VDGGQRQVAVSVGSQDAQVGDHRHGTTPAQPQPLPIAGLATMAHGRDEVEVLDERAPGSA